MLHKNNVFDPPFFLLPVYLSNKSVFNCKAFSSISMDLRGDPAKSRRFSRSLMRRTSLPFGIKVSTFPTVNRWCILHQDLTSFFLLCFILLRLVLFLITTLIYLLAPYHYYNSSFEPGRISAQILLLLRLIARAILSSNLSDFTQWQIRCLSFF